MRLSPHAFVSSPEAAFIAEVSDRDINRVIDERIIPDQLVHMGTSRKVARLAAPLVAFYYQTGDVFTASMRKIVLSTVAARLAKAGARSALPTESDDINRARSELFIYEIELESCPISLDLKPFFDAAMLQARRLDRAYALISVDDDVMGGTPVFKGTRVPIDTVLASLDEGVTLVQLKRSYPFLTDELVEAARIYGQVRPRRGRPRRLAEANPDWILKSTKVIRPPGK